MYQLQCKSPLETPPMHNTINHPSHGSWTLNIGHSNYIILGSLESTVLVPKKRDQN